MRRRPALRAAALILGLVALAGCDVSHLQFTGDHRLSFQAPRARHRVTVPVTISWTMQDFDATGLDGSTDKGHGVFAVFLDRSPMPVGKDLKWVGSGDTGCKRDPRCPDQQYLADRGVFVTTATSLTVSILPAQSSGVGDEQHYVTIVLLDGAGRRLGESAWYLPFTSKRRSSS